MKTIKLWRLFLAYFRLNRRAVCEMSVGRGLHDDFHDYPDAHDVGDSPMHDYVYRCHRCSKEFTI